MLTKGFWLGLEELVAMCDLVIDRPRGTPHPRYPDRSYPLDYGYLAGSQSADGEGIDVWVGDDPVRSVVAVVCTVDLLKRDVEIKILLGCTCHEADRVLAFHNMGDMAAVLVYRPDSPAQEAQRDGGSL